VGKIFGAIIISLYDWLYDVIKKGSISPAGRNLDTAAPLQNLKDYDKTMCLSFKLQRSKADLFGRERAAITWTEVRLRQV